MRKRISKIIIGIIFLVLILIKFMNFELLDVRPYFEVERITYILILCIPIVFLVIFSTKTNAKKLSFWKILWIYPLVFILAILFIKDKDIERIDYVLASEITQFDYKINREKQWIIHEFHINQDTIYYSQNSNFEKIYEGKFNVYKSRFIKHYHLKTK